MIHVNVHVQRGGVSRETARGARADVGAFREGRLQWIAGIALNNTQRSHVLAAMDVFLDTPGILPRPFSYHTWRSRPRTLFHPLFCADARRSRLAMAVFTTGSAVAEGLLAATPIITLPHRKLVSRLAASMVLSAYPEPGGPPLLEDHPPTLITRTIGACVS